MKSQRKCLIKEIKAHCALTLNEPVGQVQQFCNKLYTKPQSDWKNVESFLKLREMKCDKSLALIYSSKKNCRIDQPIPQVRNNMHIHSTKSTDNKNITREIIQHFQINKAKQYEYIDTSLKKMYQIQDKSAQEYQSYLSKHFEDQSVMSKAISFNLQSQSRFQLFEKLRNINKNAINRQSQQTDLMLSKQDESKLIKIETTLRSSDEQSNLELSPTTQCDDGQNHRIKTKLKSLICPKEQNQIKKNKQLTIPYFSKNQLFTKKNHFFVTNQDCENNQSLDNNTNINSLIRNKSSMLSREMKRFRIQTEQFSIYQGCLAFTTGFLLINMLIASYRIRKDINDVLDKIERNIFYLFTFQCTNIIELELLYLAFIIKQYIIFMSAIRILRLLSVVLILENFTIMQNESESFYKKLSKRTKIMIAFIILILWALINMIEGDFYYCNQTLWICLSSLIFLIDILNLYFGSYILANIHYYLSRVRYQQPTTNLEYLKQVDMQNKQQQVFIIILTELISAATLIFWDYQTYYEEESLFCMSTESQLQKLIVIAMMITSYQLPSVGLYFVFYRKNRKYFVNKPFRRISR
ncbi:unnamed protein product [Paramecium sonneborni]|uniref:Uncharacterized protein n=1 Tax=Paramecium sonneborni TaxID=65129 RepID=A0A8S1N0P9_9CILI|nr:unnamed protein product [Paramecium sonneborni]